MVRCTIVVTCTTACLHVQGLTEDSGEQTEAAALALSWKKKLYYQRTMEAITAPRGARGLRQLSGKRFSTPSLANYLHGGLQTSPTRAGTGYGAKTSVDWK